MERLQSLTQKPKSREFLKQNLALKLERAGLEYGKDWNFINLHVYTAICIHLHDPKNTRLVPKEIDQTPVDINPYYTKV